MPLVLMDAPYRLGALLDDVSAVLGRERQVVPACDLTLAGERIYRGAVAAVRRAVGERKADAVLIVR